MAAKIQYGRQKSMNVYILACFNTQKKINVLIFTE